MIRQTKQKPSTERRIPAVAIAEAPRLLAAAGIDPAAVARAAGLDPAAFVRPAETIAFADLGRYFERAARALGNDSFGLRVGLGAGPSALDILGFLVINTADVRGALATLARYIHHYEGVVVVGGDHGIASLGCTFTRPDLEGAMLIQDAGIGLAVAILRALCGPAWSPVEIQLSRPQPPDPAAWERRVGAPITFGMAGNAVLFSAKWLVRPVERADPELRRILSDKLAVIDAAGACADFPARVAALVRAGILAGEATLPEIAARLAVSPATLKRRLAEAGTTHSGLVDATRREMACQLMRNPSASLTRISDILGYRHPSGFSRAFARWTGMAPREWQQRAGRPSAPEPESGPRRQFETPARRHSPELP